MNIFNEIKAKIEKICLESFGDAAKDSLKNITVEIPKDETHGDISSNAAMVLAKPMQMKPRDIADKIIEELKQDPDIKSVEAAGPGFINLFLNKSVWINVLTEVEKQDVDFGKSNIGKGEKINIEYVSANPTGPMHIGHARNAIVGDAIANITELAGYDVVKEYYINDAGAQVEILLNSLLLRYREVLGENIGEIPQGLYPGEYLIEVAEKAVAKFGDKFKNVDNKAPAPQSDLNELKQFAIDEMMATIRKNLEQLGVRHDVFTSEKKVLDDGYIEKSFEVLEKKGLLYHGILEAPKGKVLEDWEPREQLLFKSKQFGDDTDRPLKKSDGSNTYFTGDIAYHLQKVERGFKKMMIILGADHGGYVKRLKSVVKALSDNESDMEVILSQLVKVMENGEPVKMSKRAGNFILMSEVLDKVGKDVLRFIMLTRKADQGLDFDLAKVLETTKENPVFYVQYAHARINSIFRQAEEVGVDLSKVENADINKLGHDKEIELCKKIAEFPRVIEQAALHIEPHRVTFYLYDLASIFHSLWNLGREEGIKFIDSENLEVTFARLKLAKACKTTIANGLSALGVSAMEKM